MVESIGEVAGRVVGVWDWWVTALADPSQIGGKSAPIHEGHPQQGFYRTKRKGGPYEPVAIWKDDGGAWVALRSGREVDAVDIWTWCCRNPVSREAYDAAVETGRWPDDDETVSAQITPPTVGDNSEKADETEELKDQIDAALLGVDKYATINDDETASKALSLRNRLNELSNAAEKVRVKQKDPHLEACKAVDKKWNPLVKGAKAGAVKIRDAIDAWGTKKLADQRKKEREAEAARIAAEQARIATESVTERDEGNPAAVEPEEAKRAPAEPSAQVKATYGKSASVKAVTVVDEVTDWPALAVYMSSHPECRELLLKLAQRAVDAGRTVPGITTKEEAKIR